MAKRRSLHALSDYLGIKLLAASLRSGYSDILTLSMRVLLTPWRPKGSLG